MKRNPLILAGLVAASLFAPLLASAQYAPATNRLTFSARFGLNISAKFSGPIIVPPSSRLTPNGDPYNYDNGYVLPDINTVEYNNPDGFTWYVGYDNYSGQPSPNDQVDEAASTLLFSRSAGPANLRSPGLEDDLSHGAEITYLRELQVSKRLRFGIEGAANYLGIGMRGNGGYAVLGPTVTHGYPFFPGTPLEPATPDNPYQGTYQGPGFLLGTNIVSSMLFSESVVATVAGSREFEADLFGGRVGPYLEYYLNENVSLSLSGGLAVGWLNGSASWNETLTFANGVSRPDVGSGSDQEFLWGGYVAANVFWRVTERWSATAGAQFQSLGTYEETFGSRQVELDLSKSCFFTVGVAYNF